MSENPQPDEQGRKPAQPVQIGSYRLLQPLGAGGMSSVYRAVHDESGHEVALKILPRRLAKNPAMLQRFLREARNAESLQHPNIVQIYDRGSEGGLYYLALEYIQGGDLNDKVRRDGPLPIAQALALIQDVCQGLSYAATRGVIHRDIKPANLLLGSDGHVKVTDLGLALQEEDDDERVTRDGTTVGTVDYMAPEQARDSRAASIRSDIYSLGCTLYFLLTGKPPFGRGDVPERLRKHAYDAIPNVQRIRPDVPESIAILLRRMMAKKPEHRFERYEAILDYLSQLPPLPDSDSPIVLIDDSVESRQEDTAHLLPDRSPIEGKGPSLEPAGARHADWVEAHLPDQGDTSLRGLLGSSDHAMKPPERATGKELKGKEKAAAEGYDLSPALRPISEELVPLPPVAPKRGLASTPAESPPRQKRRAESPPPKRTERERARFDEMEILPDSPDPTPMPTGFVRPQVALEREPISAKTASKYALQAAVGLGLLAACWAGIQALIDSSRKTEGPAAPAVAAVVDAVPAGVARAEGGVFWIPAQAESLPASVATEKAPAANLEIRKPEPKPWTEPVEAMRSVVPAQPVDAEVLARLGLEDVVKGQPVRWPGPVTSVRRAISDRGRGILESVRRGLDQIAGTLELADDGPFFEQDLKINGTPRAIRAAEGHRPVLVVDTPRSPSVLDRPAVFTLDGKTLILQGIDLVVPTAGLPANQTAVFLNLGGDLILRDCTVTVVGRRDAPLSLFQLGQPGVAAEGPISRLRLERTLVRAPGATAFFLVDGAASVQMVDSMILAGPQPVFRLGGDAQAARQVDAVRTLVKAGGTLIELAESVGANGGRPAEFRWLDCTLIGAGGGAERGLICDGDVSAENRSEGSGLSWNGSGNAYSGWPSGPTGSEPGSGRVRVSGPQGLDPATEQSEARLSLTAESLSGMADTWVEPESILSLLGDRGSLYSSVSSPRPNLQPWTVQSFPLLKLKEVDPEEGHGSFQRLAQRQLLNFDADDARLNGDLGRYLAEAVRSDTRSIRLEVKGNGRKWVTPFALRPGVSLEIEVPPVAPGGEPLLFVPRETAEGDALILVKDAALSLVGVQLERDARGVLKELIRVEHGRLRLDRCTLRAPMQVEPGGGSLVEFRTDGSRPLQVEGVSTSELVPEWTSSRCLFMTGGRLMSAAIGRGLVRFEQSTLVAGGIVFQLDAEPVASQRLEADLQLDRCTIIAERDVARLGPWLGGKRAPVRPFVLSTKGCAIFDSFDRGPAPSTMVLLRANAESLTHGLLVWQSDHDAYAVTKFVTTGEIDQAPTSFPDLRRDWVGFWGESHIREPIEAKGLIRLTREKLRPDAVDPKDVVVRAVNLREQALELGADAAVIESEVPITKSTLPPPDPSKKTRNK